MTPTLGEWRWKDRQKVSIENRIGEKRRREMGEMKNQASENDVEKKKKTGSEERRKIIGGKRRRLAENKA
jgi:hypothetical protein